MKTGRKIAVVALLTLSAVMVLAALVLFFSVTDDASLNANALPKAEKDVILLDINGQRMKESDYVRLNEISAHIKNAFIAIEDKRFYQHSGFDVKRTVAALIKDIKDRKFSQGGSTISNQLVKNTQLGNEKTIKRKLKEAKITRELEKDYSKDQILEMYLNVLYFGKGIYGVKNACRMLYDKLPNEITPTEAASLAATIANPSKYSVLLDPAANRRRTELVLDLMHEQGYLSEAEHKTALRSDIILNYGNIHMNYDEIYNNLALNSALEALATSRAKAATAPFYIHTYFDPTAQKAANNALFYLNDTLDATKEIVIADNQTGAVIAYASTEPTAYNLKRQPGSLLKPFIYAKAIENGALLPDSPVWDQPITSGDYRPANYGNQYYGWITAREALSRSVNTAAVTILQQIGIDEAVKTIQNAGIPLDTKDKTPSLALGGTTYGSTVLDLAEGYLTLANGGNHQKLTPIRMITDKNGKIIYQNDKKSTLVLSKEAAFLTTDMLKHCAKTGTAKQLSYLNYDIAAKTGTVSAKQGNSDAWCAAYTSEHTFVCRYSCGETPFDSIVTGGNLPTKTVRAAMKSLYSSAFPAAIAPPAGLRTTKIDKTIKNEFHKLVPYKNTGFGEEEAIYTTKNFRFDAIDTERLLLGELSVSAQNGAPTVRFQAFPGIEYNVLINGVPCVKTESGYQASKQRFPIGKLEIYCNKNERLLWKTTRLIRLY